MVMAVDIVATVAPLVEMHQFWEPTFKVRQVTKSRHGQFALSLGQDHQFFIAGPGSTYNQNY